MDDMFSVNNSSCVGWGISIDRLRELAEADKDGRCVILPCTVKLLLEQLKELRGPEDDSEQTYNTGYMEGNKKGKAEMLEYLLGIKENSHTKTYDVIEKEKQK